MAESTKEMSAKELLAKLEAEAAATIVAIAQLRRMMGMPAWEGASSAPIANGSTQPVLRTEGAVSSAVQISEDEFFRMSIPDAVVKLLQIMKKPQQARSIVDALQNGGMLSNAKNFASNVQTAIGRLKDSNVIASTPAGWGLVEWYPNRPKVSVDTKKKGQPKSKPLETQTVAPAATPAATSSPKRKRAKESAYSQFMSEQRAKGVKMVDANRAWQAQKELNTLL